MLKKLMLTAAAVAGIFLATPAQAYEGNSCGTGCYNSCCWNPCQGGPLCCGGFSVAVRGGVVPAVFTDRGEVYAFEQMTLPGAVVAIGSVPEFSDVFSLPWEAGVEVAWNASCRVQFFLEYAYNQASGKHRNFTANSRPLSVDLSDYKINNGYLGVRYYFDKFNCFSYCGPIAPYVGFKAGFSWQQRVRHELMLDNEPVANGNIWFERQTAVSAGLIVGLEWWLCKCWSLMLQGEFIANQGLRGNPNIELDDPVVTNINVGCSGWVVTFPVTLGLRWTF